MSLQAQSVIAQNASVWSVLNSGMCAVTDRAYNKKGTGVDFYGVEVLCVPRSRCPSVLLPSDSITSFLSPDTFISLLPDVECSVFRIVVRPDSAGLFCCD